MTVVNELRSTFLPGSKIGKEYLIRTFGKLDGNEILKSYPVMHWRMIHLVGRFGKEWYLFCLIILLSSE
jgi:hypothetical protein